MGQDSLGSVEGGERNRGQPTLQMRRGALEAEQDLLGCPGSLEWAQEPGALTSVSLQDLRVR